LLSRDGKSRKGPQGPFLLDFYHKKVKLVINRCMDKYTKWYNQITDRARDRIVEDYTERHHVKPRSLGGTDDADNLVDLTAREHFICHWLLTKMTTGEDRAKMIYALNGMKRSNKFAQRYETKITARVYESLKKEFAEVHSATMKGRKPWNVGIPITEEQREKNRKAATGKKRSAEAIAKTVAKQKGQKRSQETKDRIRAALKGKPKGPMSVEEKLKRSIALKGKSKPDGFGKHLVEIKRKEWSERNPNQREDLKKKCLHCGGIFGPSNFSRWHGLRCKNR